jgi:4-nitrophenyl phosphatase
VQLEPDQIINSPMAAAEILEQRFPGGGPVYIFGEEGLHSTLKEHGYYHAVENVKAVVVGLYRHATFEDFCAATTLIRSGVPFIGTNPDKTFPQPNGIVIPGTGPYLAFFEASTGVKPTIAGKPSRFLFSLAQKRLGVPPEQTLAVGDRLETDIAGAKEAGCRTALVLSGVSKLKDVENFSPRPDLIAKDLIELLAE